MVSSTSSRSSELARPTRSPFSLLRNDLDTFFDDFWRRNRRPELDGGTNLFPAVNLSETNDAYRVSADLPGMKREDVTVSAEGDALVISGTRSEESEEKGRNWHCRECVTGEFRRVVGLGEDADVAKATAAMNNGVLTVNVPKNPDSASRRRVIPIEQTSGAGARTGRNP